MSHQALDKTSKGKSTNPNVWFVGLTPRRNPELVVAVLWQNGDKSYYPARLGARFVAAYVEKQRRLAHNLQPAKAAVPAKPVEVGAVWSDPDGVAGHIHGGHFTVNPTGDTEIAQTPSAVASFNPEWLRPARMISTRVHP